MPTSITLPGHDIGEAQVLLGAEFTRVYTEHYERRRPPPQEFAEKDPHAVKPPSAGTSRKRRYVVSS